MIEEVKECDIGNINIKHADPVDISIDIEFSMKDEKLAKLQECDPHIKHLRKQYSKNSLDKSIYTMENNILRWRLIKNGLLYTPIVVLDILKNCLLILAHNKSGHNGFRRTYGSLKNRYYWKGLKKICTPTMYQMPSMCQAQHQNTTAEK